MNWEQKLQALLALEEPVEILLDAFGKFMLRLKADVGGDGFLSGRCHGHGETVQQAVEDCWTGCTPPEPGRYLVFRAGQSGRRHVRWNGFMWVELPVGGRHD